MPQTIDLSSLIVGALITIAVSYVATRHQHRNEVDREAARKKRELLERVAMEVAAYMAAPTAYAHALGIYLATNSAGDATTAGRDLFYAEDTVMETLEASHDGMISHSWQRLDEPRLAPVYAGLDNLSRAHEQLARAIYWASLTADAGVAHALDEFWTIATSSYPMFRRRFVEIDIAALNEMMIRLSGKSEAVRKELGRAYSATFRA